MSKLQLSISCHPSSLTIPTGKRGGEIAKILAAGLIRMQQQKAIAPAKQKSDVSSKPAASASKLSSKSGDYLTEGDLARRWICSTSRLQRWRSRGERPAYLKIARKILYQLQDIQAFEQSCQSGLKTPTPPQEIEVSAGL